MACDTVHIRDHNALRKDWREGLCITVLVVIVIISIIITAFIVIATFPPLDTTQPKAW
jgi:hypothetical protein